MDGIDLELDNSPPGSYRKTMETYDNPDEAIDATNYDGHTALPDVTTVCPIDSAGVESDVSKSPRNYEAKTRLERARSRYLTVEIPLVLVTLGISILVTTKPQYIRDRVAQDEFNRSLITDDNVSSCDVNTTHADAEIQAIASNWLLILGAIGAIPGVFAAIFFGSLSDRIGRKPALILCSSGYLGCIGWYILVIYFHLPLLAFLPGDLLSGLTGGTSLLLATSASYVADVSSTKMRTIRIVLVEGAFFIGFGVGQIALGFAVYYNTDQTLNKYILPLWISLACVLTAIVYVCIPQLVIETIDTKASSKRNSEIKTFFAEVVNLLKENTNRRRVKLISYTATMMFAVFIVQANSLIFIIYAIGQPFCLSPLEIALVGTIAIGVSAIGLIAGGAILPKLLSDNWIIQFCLLNAGLACLATGLANTISTLIIASCIGLFRGLSFPVIRSQLSKISAEHERSLMLAFVGCMDGLAAFFSPLVANSIYSATVFFNPAFVFYILTALAVVPCFIVGGLQFLEWKGIPHNRLTESE